MSSQSRRGHVKETQCQDPCFEKPKEGTVNSSQCQSMRTAKTGLLLKHLPVPSQFNSEELDMENSGHTEDDKRWASAWANYRMQKRRTTA